MVLALARPSEPWCFSPGSDFFETVLLLAAASNRICRKIVFSRMSDDTLGTSIYLVYISIRFQDVTFGNFLIYMAPMGVKNMGKSTQKGSNSSSSRSSSSKQHHSSSSHQQQHQQQAAGRRQQQAAAGISKQQQTQADAAAVSATAAVQQLAARKIVFF